ncbi:glycosyltransferase [Arsenophonus apicola]|uniref:Glycosyltransferase n=1 Tax=Arsenophonus apicola TaxID=2879119 RepID=A0ABY8P2B2_9GAMM|nr:glycosyltransferase [Arsenophonus apicola]WGO83648.1 glycosyltransferase [Arsenophonus apicola]
MKKKIVFVVTKSGIGGAQTWIYELKKIIQPYYDIYLIVSEHGWLTDKFDKNKVKIIPDIIKFFSFKASYKIAKYLKTISADVIISNSANAGVHARLSKLLYNHKHIYVSHGWSCIYNGGKFKKLFCFIEKTFSSITDCILCVSNRDSNNAINIIGIDEKKISIIRNSISPLTCKVTKNKRKKIIFLGRLVHPKRPDLFIHASKYFPDADFYLVGDGPQKYLFEGKENKRNNLFFLGEIKNFNSFHEYDIFILCSDSEGLPMSALEAASAGLPLLLSNVGGCAELIFSKDGISNGLLFENTLDSLNCAIKNMLDDYDIFLHKAQSLRAEFDIANVLDSYIKIIEE